MDAWVAAGAIVLMEEADREKGIPYQWVFLGLIAFALLFFMRQSQRRRSQSAARVATASSDKDSQPARGPGTSRGQQDPEVARLYVELNEFAREMEGRMDTKIVYLRRLIADAEKVLTGLGLVIAEAEAVRKGEQRPGAEGIPPATPPGAPAPGREAASASPDPAAASPPPTIDITIGDGPDPDHRGSGQEVVRKRILGLASEGKPKEAIAEEVGVPKGEVELVLSLHRASQKKKQK